MLNKFTVVSDNNNDKWLIETELNEDDFGIKLQHFQVNDFKDSSKLTLEQFVEKLKSEGFIIDMTKLDNIFSWWAN